jgi:hypothetical protein
LFTAIGCRWTLPSTPGRRVPKTSFTPGRHVRLVRSRGLRHRFGPRDTAETTMLRQDHEFSCTALCTAVEEGWAAAVPDARRRTRHPGGCHAAEHHDGMHAFRFTL